MIKKKVKITSLAIADLKNIWLYTFENWGIGQADKYAQQIRDSYHNIQNVMFKQLKKGNVLYKTYTIEKHRIILKETPDSFLIIRVLHQSMDVKRHL